MVEKLAISANIALRIVTTYYVPEISPILSVDAVNGCNHDLYLVQGVDKT